MTERECTKDREPAAEKILYEVDMVRWIGQQISQEAENKRNSIRTNDLLLEGLLLHARVLYDFLVHNPKQDDISAQDYFDDSSDWKKTAEKLCPYLSADEKKNYKRLNKKLAHLTYSRLTEDKDWDFKAIASELQTAWETFQSDLPAERQKWFPLNAYSSARDEPKDNP